MMSRSATDAGTAAGLMVPWVLRTGVAMCFIGHGCYGIMTKAAWLPYFGVVGIGEALSWKFMPWIGAMDIALGFLALVWLCRAALGWGVLWCVWTALLRPLAGQGWPEFFERAGNYGVPLALLVLYGWKGSAWGRLEDDAGAKLASRARALQWTLRFVTASLLAGHAACALWLRKPALAHHYAVFGASDPAALMIAVGWLEAGLAVAALVVRTPAFFLALGVWKLATESLMLTSGAPAPFFDFVEHGGSYAAPLALACLLFRPATPIPTFNPQAA